MADSACSGLSSAIRLCLRRSGNAVTGVMASWAKPAIRASRGGQSVNVSHEATSHQRGQRTQSPRPSGDGHQAQGSLSVAAAESVGDGVEAGAGAIPEIAAMVRHEFPRSVTGVPSQVAPAPAPLSHCKSRRDPHGFLKSF